MKSASKTWKRKERASQKRAFCASEKSGQKNCNLEDKYAASTKR